ncbi:MAG: MarR family winged helix-turn-helix transcriptional regulator [Acidothermaceae bacterium]
MDRSASRAPARPSPGELFVWRSFLRAHAHVLRTLERELDEAQQLPLASYDVLVQLSEAPKRRLRMTELAERVLLSRSGLTRLVDRLERDGLVRREPCPDDARGLFAVATESGIDRLRESSRVHLDGVARHFVGRFTASELDALGKLLGRVST